MAKLKVDKIEAQNSTFVKLIRKLPDGSEVEADDSQLNNIFRRPTTVTGQQQYTSYGTYSWVVPADVYDVHVVCIGGGGGGYDGWANPSGGGGGLGWKNNIPVTPGETIQVQVGQGGYSYDEQSSAPFGGSFRMNGGTS